MQNQFRLIAPQKNTIWIVVNALSIFLMATSFLFIFFSENFVSIGFSIFCSVLFGNFIFAYFFDKTKFVFRIKYLLVLLKQL